jgi:aminoglycoside N3'-acetyltransferase
VHNRGCFGKLSTSLAGSDAIKPGDGLFVHSSYSTIGKVLGGPDMVIDALLEAVGAEGHIMFPAFAFHIDAILSSYFGKWCHKGY